MSVHLDSAPPPSSLTFTMAGHVDQPQPTFAMSTRLSPVESLVQSLQCPNRWLSANMVGDLPREPHWLENIYSKVSAGKTASATDLLFDTLDGLLSDERFEECEDILRLIDLSRLDTHLMVALLTITLGAKERLPRRASILTRIEARLNEIDPRRTERLLAGLR